MNEKKYAYHLLYEQTHGKSEIQRVDANNIVVHLPKEKIVLPVDYREKRILVIFDGFIVSGGLPKNATVAHYDSLDDLSVRIEQVRNPDNRMEIPDLYHDNDLETGPIYLYAKHRRYFILLPSCRAVVFRYRPKSLSPQGVVIEVEKGKVRFLTTTY